MAYDYPWDYGEFTWNDDHCDRALRYVCQVYTEDFHPPVDPWLPDGVPNNFGCKSGWTKFAGGCYRYFGDSRLDDQKKSWQDANDYCAQIWTGASLAIFPNQFYQSFATSLMTYYTEKPWIGLVNAAQDRNFHWVSSNYVR